MQPPETQPPKTTQPAPPPTTAPVKRLSIELTESLHQRFKTACSATNRRMASEVVDLVERRTAELENEAGLRTDHHDALRRRSDIIDQALTCNHPTGDIEQILADIARRRDLR